MTTKTLKDFLTDMEPYYGLFDSVKDIESYYKAMAARMPKIAAVYLRMAIRRLGYNVVVPAVHSPEVSEIRDIIGDVVDVFDWNWACSLLPFDFIATFHGGYLGTQLSGDYKLSDLLSVQDDGRVVITRRETLLRDILLRKVIYGQRNYFSENLAHLEIYGEFERNRRQTDATSLYKALLAREFLVACQDNAPDKVTRYVARGSHDYIDTRLRVLLTLERQIVVDERLVCEHTLGRVKTIPQLAWFFDRLSTAETSTGGAVPVLTEFIDVFRLDDVFTERVNRNIVPPSA